MTSVFPAVTRETVARYEIPAPRYTSYPTAPAWRELHPADYARRLVIAGAIGKREPLALYFHLPFCEELCSYCGCNVIVARGKAIADRYLDRLLAEVALAARRLGPRRRFDQLHYGGGTPTFLTVPQLRRLFAGIREHFEPTPDAELSIEVDPVVTTDEQLSLLREQGFDRISLGVQDLDPTVQRAVRREQSAEQTASIVATARRLGFRSVNFDLIYGLPHQTSESYRRTMEAVLAMRPDRAAVYSFAYLPELRTHQRRIDAAAVPTGERKLELFALAYDAFAGAGYRPIGMDHFALPGDDLARAQAERRLSRNFQGYTARRSSDVVAFGASAISDVAGLYAQSSRPTNRYFAALDRGAFATERGFFLSADDLRRRRVIADILCNFHVDLAPYGDAFDRERTALERLEAEGLVVLSGDTVELTSLGRVFVRNVAAVFDAYLEVRPVGYSKTV